MRQTAHPSFLRTVLMRCASSVTPGIEDLPEADLIVSMIALRISDLNASQKRADGRILRREARRFLVEDEADLWAGHIGLCGDLVRRVAREGGYSW